MEPFGEPLSWQDAEWATLGNKQPKRMPNFREGCSQKSRLGCNLRGSAPLCDNFAWW
jgi:hypothetical protein